MDTVTDAIMATCAFGLRACLRVVAAAIQYTTALRALDVIGQKGHAQTDTQSVDVGVGVKHRAVRRVQARYP